MLCILFFQRRVVEGRSVAWVCVVGDSAMYPTDNAFLTYCSSLRITADHSASGGRFEALVKAHGSNEAVLHAIAEKVEVNEMQVKIMKGIMGGLGA
jgi:hypothetical protein